MIAAVVAVVQLVVFSVGMVSSKVDGIVFGRVTRQPLR